MSGCSNDIPMVSFAECTAMNNLREMTSVILPNLFTSGFNRKFLKLLQKQYKIISIEYAGDGVYDEDGKWFDQMEGLHKNLRFKYKFEYMHPDEYVLKKISHGREIKSRPIFVKCF